MLSEEMKRDLTLAGVCTGALALLLAPASVVTLGLGVAIGYQGREQIRTFLKGGEKG